MASRTPRSAPPCATSTAACNARCPSTFRPSRCSPTRRTRACASIPASIRARIRLTGNVVGEPPFNGTLRHHGWRVREVKLPELVRGDGELDPVRGRARRGRARLMSARFVVGIDLGTTNSAVAFAPIGEAGAGSARVSGFPIAQLIAPGEVEPRASLPSFLYLPAAGAARRGRWPCPGATPGWVVGEFARARGAEVPTRLVSSAKSWLSHGGVDRTAPILPLASGPIPESRCRASRRSRPRRATSGTSATPGTTRFAAEGAPLAEQDVLLTVPASFDAVARELTVRAAAEAGLPHVTLLEEPQAAFYAWLAKRGDGWRQRARGRRRRARLRRRRRHHRLLA